MSHVSRVFLSKYSCFPQTCFYMLTHSTFSCTSLFKFPWDIRFHESFVWTYSFSKTLLLLVYFVPSFCFISNWLSFHTKCCRFPFYLPSSLLTNWITLEFSLWPCCCTLAKRVRHWFFSYQSSNSSISCASLSAHSIFSLSFSPTLQIAVFSRKVFFVF